MATSLLSNENSHDQELENILTDNPGTIMTLVEDESDVAIWKEILQSVWPHKKFKVSPYSDSNQNGKGKAGILSKASDFGAFMIGCIDSDYDWILQQYTHAGQIISSNQYIIQTIAYGVENLLIRPYDIASCMRISTAHDCEAIDTLDDDYENFLYKVSSIIYLPLLWHLLRIKQQVDIQQVSEDWKKLFSGEHYKEWTSDKNLICQDVWEYVIIELQTRADALIAEYEEKYSDLREELQTLKEELASDRNLNEANAFLFAPTHQIFNFMNQVFFKSMESRLRNEHMEDIAIGMAPQAQKEAKRHYHDECMPFIKIRKSRHSFLLKMDDAINRLIRKDIAKCFS